MAKRLQDYVKYTLKELESYAKKEGSCVRKVNSNLHLSLGPYSLADFKHALSAHIMRRKVGYYDASLEGIVLDIKNIKILGTTAAMRTDDPRLHVDVNADCYVFKPVAGAILSGVVKHVGNHHIGVIIYRVFNVSIRFIGKLNKEEIDMDDTVQFRIKNFNLQNVFPFIEGDLVTANGDTILNKFIKMEPESVDSNQDSGIEERENHDLDALVTLIKKEHESEDEARCDVSLKAYRKRDKNSATKRKSSLSNTLTDTPVLIKVEPVSEKKKRKHADNNEDMHTASFDDNVPAAKSKKKKANSELLNITEIKLEKDVDSPKKNRKTKRLVNDTS